jgi:hypothetical protein
MTIGSGPSTKDRYRKLWLGLPGTARTYHALLPRKMKSRLITTNMQQLLEYLRIVVEWVFKEITQQFAYLSWKREQKVFLKALGEEYSVGVLLHNARVCLHHPHGKMVIWCDHLMMGRCFIRRVYYRLEADLEGLVPGEC